MKDMAASILERLRNHSKATGLGYQLSLQLFCQEEFLRRLSLSPYKNNFVLKGGWFVYALTDFQSRVTQDIDFLMCRLSNELADVSGVIEEISQIHTLNDYITFEVVRVERITPDREYPGVSVRLIGRIKQMRIPFSIDIGMDDLILPKPLKRSIKTRLPDFEEPEILTYSLESTIAEKFDALLKRMESTSRMKDLFDIYYLSNLFDFDGRALQDAVWNTIKHRGTVFEANCFDRISSFGDDGFLSARWTRFQPSMQMELPEFAVVLRRLKEFLQPILEESIQERELQMNWSAKEKQWQERRA